ncbi:MAG: pentapeptide repeat-containing protein [Pirellulales bacterium]
MSRLSFFVVSLAIGLCPVIAAHAQIYRWDNGQVIPGTEGIKLGPGVLLSGWNSPASNLRYGNFKGDLSKGDLKNSWFDSARFSGTNLTGADLSYASFDSVDFTGANLTDAIVTGANFSSTTSRGLTEAQLKSTAGYRTKDLHEIWLGYNDLDGWDFRRQNLARAHFGSAHLVGTQLTDANLSQAQFSMANLNQANLTRANLSSANLWSAVLTDADLKGADLSGAWVTGSILAGVNLTDANVSGANFSNTTSQGFTEAQLKSTQTYAAKDLGSIGLSQNDLTGWDLSGQNLVGAGFNSSFLTNTSLAGSDLSNADLRSARMTNANLAGSNLANAQMVSVTFVDTNVAGSNLTNADLEYSQLVKVDLTGSNLTNANLSNISNFGGAILTGATVNQARFGYATRAGFTAAQLYSTHSYRTKNLSGIELGPDNDLSGWDFTGQKLENASFLSSKLTKANLARANLMNSNLEHATLQGADVSWADLRGAKAAVLSGAAQENTILSGGQINGPVIADGETLTIRDDDGVTAPVPANWLKPRQPFPILIYQQMTVSDSGTLQLLFESDPWDSVIRFEPGIPVNLTGTLDLTFTEDTQLSSQSGRTIKVFDWTGVNPQGVFTVAIPPGTAWDTSQLYTTGEVTLLGISSDLNGDKDVDSEDLLNILANWTDSNYPAADKTWQQGDSDADGDVDSADMLVFLSQWTGAAAAEALPAESVPEPSCAALAGLMGVLIAGHSRRRRLVL